MEIMSSWFARVRTQQALTRLIVIKEITDGQINDVFEAYEAYNPLAGESAEWVEKANKQIVETHGFLDIMYPKGSDARSKLFLDELTTFLQNLSTHGAVDEKWAQNTIKNIPATFNLAIMSYDDILELKERILLEHQKLFGGDDVWRIETYVKFLMGQFNVDKEAVELLRESIAPNIFVNVQRGKTRAEYLEHIISDFINTLNETVVAKTPFVKSARKLNSETKTKEALRGQTESIIYVDDSPFMKSKNDVQTVAQQQANMAEFEKRRLELLEGIKSVISTLELLTPPEETGGEFNYSPSSNPENTLSALVDDLMGMLPKDTAYTAMVRRMPTYYDIEFFKDGIKLYNVSWDTVSFLAWLEKNERSGFSILTDSATVAREVFWRPIGFRQQYTELRKLFNSETFMPKSLRETDTRYKGFEVDLVAMAASTIRGYVNTLRNAYNLLNIELKLVRTTINDDGTKHIERYVGLALSDAIMSVINSKSVDNTSLVIESVGNDLSYCVPLGLYLKAARNGYRLHNNYKHGGLVNFTVNDLEKEDADKALDVNRINPRNVSIGIADILHNILIANRPEEQPETAYNIPPRLYALMFEEFSVWLERRIWLAYEQNFGDLIKDVYVRSKVEPTMLGVAYTIYVDGVVVDQGMVNRSYFERALEWGLEFSDENPNFFSPQQKVLPTIIS